MTQSKFYKYIEDHKGAVLESDEVMVGQIVVVSETVGRSVKSIKRKINRTVYRLAIINWTWHTDWCDPNEAHTDDFKRMVGYTRLCYKNGILFPCARQRKCLLQDIGQVFHFTGNLKADDINYE